MSRRAALDGLAHGLELALQSVRKLMDETDPDEWVDQLESPLGRRRHCELSRSGAFPSARRDRGRWYVRRRDLDAYIEGHSGPSTEAQQAANEAAEILSFRAPAKRGKK